MAGLRKLAYLNTKGLIVTVRIDRIAQLEGNFTHLMAVKLTSGEVYGCVEFVIQVPSTRVIEVTDELPGQMVKKNTKDRHI